MSTLLKGIAASPGIVIAKTFRVASNSVQPQKTEIQDIEQEWQRFVTSCKSVKQDLGELHLQTLEKLGSQKAEIFEAHLMLLEDPEFLEQIQDKIQDEHLNAEVAVYEVAQFFIGLFEEMEDELLKARASDLKDVTNRILSTLQGKKYGTALELQEECIILADDLSPSDTAQLDLKLVKGFITEQGSRTSHSAIMAKSLGIPAVVGAGEQIRSLPVGVTVILDGTAGTLLVDPTDEELLKNRTQQAEDEALKFELRQFVTKPTFSIDQHQVELAANIGSVEDVVKAIENGAEGIGLFRTEFLFMGRDEVPSEDEQFQTYKYVLEKMQGKPVVIRTLDIGGDKKIPYLNREEEQNPFLGFRAIRMCLQEEDLFRTQLRALLRASSFGNLKIMFPMISVIEEWWEAKRILQEEQNQLMKQGVTLSDQIEVGMMIEVPSAAIAAHAFAKEVDFFSIGTNDLIQYTFAADRMNDKVSYLYQPYHPSILRLIQLVVSAATQEGKWVGMCGEMAGDQTAIPVLLGLGLHEFSMSASSILPTRKLIGNLSKSIWQGHIEKILSLRSQEEVREYIKEQM